MRQPPRFRKGLFGALCAATGLAASGCGSATTGQPAVPVVFPSAAPLPYPALPAVASCRPRADPAVPGLSLITDRPRDARTHELTLRSRAAGSSVHADVLLPTVYDTSGSTRYPVLYLLHGHGGDAGSWLQHGVSGVVGGTPVIVVMPDGGYDGFYADWYGSDSDGHTPYPPPAWETFHLRELIPWIDHNYPTVARREGRAVAGVSMGGFGAMTYAARHPDLFVSAASFSGVVDPDVDYPNGPAVVALANVTDHRLPDNCIFGDPASQDVVWRDHDPTYLARNLRGVSLFVSSGDGTAGANAPSDAGEQVVRRMNDAFVAALDAAGVGRVTDLYSPGTHSWQYWLRELGRYLPHLRDAFARAAPAPPSQPFACVSAASRFGVWGWQFDVRAGATAFTYLDGVSAAGLRVGGHGSVTVTSAPLYRSGVTYVVRGAAGERRVIADRSGRLHFDVDVGAAATAKQDAFDAATESSAPHTEVAVFPPA